MSDHVDKTKAGIGIGILPTWMTEKRPGKELVAPGTYAERMVEWQRITLQFVPRIDEMVELSEDRLGAGMIAYRWAVTFDKFATGGDVRDSNEARQLEKLLREMCERDEDPANETARARAAAAAGEADVDSRLAEAMTGEW